MTARAQQLFGPCQRRVRCSLLKQHIRIRRARNHARGAKCRREQLGIAKAFGLKLASAAAVEQGKAEAVSVKVSLLSGTAVQLSIAPDDTVEVLGHLVAKAHKLPCSRHVNLFVNSQELPQDSIASKFGNEFTAVLSRHKICEQCEYERIRHKLLSYIEEKEACGMHVTEGFLVAWYIDQVEQSIDTQAGLLVQHDMLMNIVQRMICVDGALLVRSESPDAFQRELIRNPEFRCQEPAPWPLLHCPVIPCLAVPPELIGRPHLAVLDACCPWAPKPQWNIRLPQSEVTLADGKLLALLQNLFKDKSDQICLSRPDGLEPPVNEVPVEMADVVDAIQRHNVDLRVAHSFMRSQLVRQNFRIEGERLYRIAKA